MQPIIRILSAHNSVGKITLPEFNKSCHSDEAFFFLYPRKSARKLAEVVSTVEACLGLYKDTHTRHIM